MTRYHAIIPETGEVVDIEGPAFRRGKKRGKRRVFALMDLDALQRLELTAAEWRVLHYMMGKVESDSNECRVARAEIATGLGVAPPNVTRVLQTLRARRIIFTYRYAVHRINAHIMFRGSVQDWETLTDTEPEPIWGRA